jgi:hypothetical protein
MSEPDRTSPADGAENEAPPGPERLRWRAAEAAPLALVGARFSALRTSLTIVFEREMERGRGFPWLPVLFSLGVLIYFILPREPLLLALVALFAALALLAWFRRHRTVAFRILLSATAVAAGLCAAKVRTDLVAAPTLSRQITTTVTGWVASEEESPKGGKRLVLRVSTMQPIPRGPCPPMRASRCAARPRRSPWATRSA